MITLFAKMYHVLGNNIFLLYISKKITYTTVQRFSTWKNFKN